jgi:hypothetical protein
MATRTLTTANSVLTVTASTVLPAPAVIQGFATEDAFSSAVVEIARAVMGVDAKKSAGYVPTIKELDIVLQADSLSRAVFEQIRGVMDNTREVVRVDVTIDLAGLGEVWTFSNGTITKAPSIPGAKKTAVETTWTISFESVTVAYL